MTQPKSPGSAPARNLIEALDDLEDDIPLSEEEQDAVLRDAQFDLASSLTSTLALVAQERLKREREAVESGSASWLATLQGLEGQLVHRPRAESLALIQALASREPSAARHLALHPGYESSSDRELDLLVAALQSLTRPATR